MTNKNPYNICILTLILADRRRYHWRRLAKIKNNFDFRTKSPDRINSRYTLFQTPKFVTDLTLAMIYRRREIQPNAMLLIVIIIHRGFTRTTRNSSTQSERTIRKMTHSEFCVRETENSFVQCVCALFELQSQTEFDAFNWIARALCL